VKKQSWIDRLEAVKINVIQFRSICSLGIIASFVLFLASSAPHRVHHFFENLSYSGDLLHEREHALFLTASNQALDLGNQDHRSHVQLASEEHRGHKHGHPHHRGDSSPGKNHKHDHKDHQHFQTQSEAFNAPHSPERPTASAAPIHANTPNDDAHHDNSAQTVCLLQVAAQHSQLSSVQLLEILFLGIEIERRVSPPAAAFSIYNPSPFSQRAPPAI
jgi:hypothetical protein